MNHINIIIFLYMLNNLNDIKNIYHNFNNLILNYYFNINQINIYINFYLSINYN